MRPLSTVSSLLFAAVSVQAFAEGTISDRSFRVEYSDYSTTLEFCTAFRKVCQDTTSSMNYAYQLDCVTSQKNPIQAFCGGIQNDASGNRQDGTVYDFTMVVCRATSGCRLRRGPSDPLASYPSEAAATTAAEAAATTDDLGNGEEWPTTTAVDDLGNGEEWPKTSSMATDIASHPAASANTAEAVYATGPVTKTVRGSFATAVAASSGASGSGVEWSTSPAPLALALVAVAGVFVGVL